MAQKTGSGGGGTRRRRHHPGIRHEPQANSLDFTRLGLDALAVSVQVGALLPGSVLPSDHFGDLGRALLAVRVMGVDPELIGASNATSKRVVTFGTAAAGQGGAEVGVGGDLVLDFAFQVPRRRILNDAVDPISGLPRLDGAVLMADDAARFGIHHRHPAASIPYPRIGPDDQRHLF